MTDTQDFKILYNSQAFYAAVFVTGSAAYELIDRIDELDQEAREEDDPEKHKELLSDRSMVLDELLKMVRPRVKVMAKADNMDGFMEGVCAVNDDYVKFFPVEEWETFSRQNIKIDQIIGLKL